MLHARVHAVEPPPELRAVLTGGAGPGGHNDERLSFVSKLVRQWGFASLMDVGCGEGKLLVRLVQDGAFVDSCVQLVGLEPDPKVGAAIVDAFTEAICVAIEVDRAELGEGQVAELTEAILGCLTQGVAIGLGAVPDNDQVEEPR